MPSGAQLLVLRGRGALASPSNQLVQIPLAPSLRSVGSTGMLPAAFAACTLQPASGDCLCPKHLFMMSQAVRPPTRRKSMLLKCAGDTAHIPASLAYAAVGKVSKSSANAGLCYPSSRGSSGRKPPCSWDPREPSHLAQQH